MTYEYRLMSSQDLIEVPWQISDEFERRRPWWRGHADATWKLVAGAHRPKAGFSLKPNYEVNTTSRFRNGARIRKGDCPNQDDFGGWLLLMQHYGLPTRLLDWSESLLTALYFSVSDPKYDTVDGALWALDASQFNKQKWGVRGFADSQNPEIFPLFQRAFNNAIPLQKIDAFAMMAEHVDLRMLMQSGHYTIHDNGTPIESLSQSDTFLRKIVIPAKKKEYWRMTLEILAIDASTLFPDLQNLANRISNMSFEQPG